MHGSKIAKPIIDDGQKSLLYSNTRDIVVNSWSCEESTPSFEASIDKVFLSCTYDKSSIMVEVDTVQDEFEGGGTFEEAEFLDAEEDLPIVYETVWKTLDGKARAGARELWKDLFDMPCEMINQRLDNLCVVAYCGDTLVGLSTINVGASRQLGLFAKLGCFLCSVRPKYRRRGIATELAIRCKNSLEEWSRDRKSDSSTADLETNIQGMFVLLDPAIFTQEKFLPPVHKPTGLALTSYTSQKQQLRVVWFDHAVLRHS